ncbi:MAG: Smr/MutS family protein [Candidatus Methylomirabilales bacterium]
MRDACDNSSDSQGAFEKGEDFVLPIDGTLDLHAFHPQDVSSVVAEYLEVCRRRGIREVRMIHGRGKGVQRKAVRATLKEIPFVVSFSDAGPELGGWGVTVAILRLAEEGPEGSQL